MNKQEKFKNIGLQDINKIIDFCNRLIKSGITVCFFGELGVGKTFLTQNLAKQLGISENITSPTFTILNQYQLPNQITILNHFDLYRIKSIDELYEIGYQDYIDNENYINFIEWSERLAGHLPKNKIEIHISYSIDFTMRDYLIYF